MAKLYHEGEYLEGGGGGTTIEGIPTYIVDIDPSYELEMCGTHVILDNFDPNVCFHIIINNIGEYNGLWPNNMTIRSEIQGHIYNFTYMITTPSEFKGATERTSYDNYYQYMSYDVIDGSFPVAKGASLELICTRRPDKDDRYDYEYNNGLLQLLTVNEDNRIRAGSWYTASNHNVISVYSQDTLGTANPFVLVTTNRVTHNKNITSPIEDPTTTLTMGVITSPYYGDGEKEAPAINQMAILGNVTLKYIKCRDHRTFQELDYVKFRNGPVIYDFYVSAHKTQLYIAFL